MPPASESNPAFLIVDVQNDFCPGGSLTVPDGNAVIPVINKILNSTQFKGGLFYSKDWHPPDHISFASNHQGGTPFKEVVLPDGTKQTLWPAHCVQGTTGAKFLAELQVADDACVILKGCDRKYDSYSAFFDNVKTSRTDLDKYLKERQVKELYVCGLALDVCVKFSVLDAIDLGYVTTVVLDACRGLSEESNQEAIAKMKDAGAKFITSEEICLDLQ